MRYKCTLWMLFIVVIKSYKIVRIRLCNSLSPEVFRTGLLCSFSGFKIQDISVTFQISSVFLPLCISSLLEKSMEETEEPMNFDAKEFVTVATCDKNQKAIIGVDEGESLSRKDEVEKYQKKDDEDTAYNDDDERDESAIADSSLERRAERQRLQRQAWHLMRNGEIEILFIASKNINPVEILEKTWSFLRLSSTIVIYCPIAEPLYSAYHWLKAKHAVQVHVVDAFYRSHQIIQDRSHPIMQQFITGSFPNGFTVQFLGIQDSRYFSHFPD
ncbi:hypothetical protein WUBG_16649 [Wuchereria bancrofti]|uniref:tRNA (adenine(58)-N(1))-methyltransferase non-catalytic subunit TRM6 n=1 Tax=Wuchereria bancrofti TaxID=6293 RepID=J9DS14_WUCBA|nr:hypothetical protein WUBG_16649 [Wuchereria bancrofti]